MTWRASLNFWRENLGGILGVWLGFSSFLGWQKCELMWDMYVFGWSNCQLMWGNIGVEVPSDAVMQMEAGVPLQRQTESLGFEVLN